MREEGLSDDIKADKNNENKEKTKKKEKMKKNKEDNSDKPLMRGKIHLCLVVVYIALLPQLLKKCSSFSSIFASIFSSVCILFNFCASALLHNIKWTEHYLKFMEKVDHMAIFLMIGGSTIPVPMLLFDLYDLICLSTLQLFCFVYGFVNIFIGSISEQRKKRSLMYVFTGLIHALFLRCYMNVLTLLEIILVFLLGFMYLIGVLVYAKKWPNPLPKYFGFHEVFHFCCFVSATCTYMLNFSVLSRAG